MAEYKRKEVKGSGGGAKTPFVAISLEKGKGFIGRLTEKPTEATQAGKFKKFIYRFALQECDAQILIRDEETKDFKEATVKQGDLVTVFATKPLHEKLTKIDGGKLVEVIWNGKLKAPKSGNYYHDFTVNELEVAQ